MGVESNYPITTDTTVFYSTTAWAHRKTHHELSGYEWTIPAFFWLLSPITVCKLYQLYEDTYNIL